MTKRRFPAELVRQRIVIRRIRWVVETRVLYDALRVLSDLLLPSREVVEGPSGILVRARSVLGLRRMLALCLHMECFAVAREAAVGAPIEIAAEQLELWKWEARGVDASGLHTERRIRSGAAVEIEQVIRDDK